MRFDTVLIANRGEIAVRIIRACREQNLGCVSVYSTADRDALHVKFADRAVCIGAPATADSYLRMDSIIEACRQTGATAVHPGFGFLSENAEFAKLCRENDITFIGPSPECIAMLGDKAQAKETMKAAGVPVIPGSEGALHSIEEANTVYLEKLIVGPHHVEVQIIADEYGNTVALGERDCSMQRRNQKVLEESPSPLMTPELRDAMQKAAVAAAKACGYCNAGTIEFLVDHERNFYFMEMNTRIQVEHPVTEWVTGIDLVQTQLRIAQGEPLPFTQEDITLRGHAIECRINAENPDCNFRPSPGTIQALHLPGGMGVRIDSAIYQGYTIPPYYDSMIAKLIVHAPTRKEAIQKMRWALSEFLVDGVETNIDFQLRLLKTEAFEQGTYDNAFLMHWLEDSKHKQS